MKSVFVFSGALLLALSFAACSGKKEGGMSATAKKNLEGMRVVTKAFETGDVSGIDAVVAENFVDHTDRGDMGRDSLKAIIAMMKTKNMGMKTEAILEMANDEYVFGWYKFTGTSDGSMGMPAGPYEMKAIELAKCKDGKAVEHWEFMEMRDMMKMMAGQQQPAADTTSHQ